MNNSMKITNTPTVFDDRSVYKPFEYEFAYKAFKAQNQVHWTPSSLQFSKDVADWEIKLDDDMRSFMGNIFRFFTQADVDVAKAYIEEYMPIFKKPELRMMMSSFAAMEAIHADAYSQVTESLGLGDDQYGKFKEFTEMQEKHEYLWENREFKDELVYNGIPIKKTLYQIAKFSAFTEGLQLYSSFIMLLNMQRHNMMKSMCQVVAWSVGDESLHVNSMLKVLDAIKEEFPNVWDAEIEEALMEMANKMVELEINFINLCYTREDGSEIEVPGLPKQEVIDFVKYTANRRLIQLGLEPTFDVMQNPSLWFDEIINAQPHANFFETHSTAYAKDAVELDTQDIDWA